MPSLDRCLRRRLRSAVELDQGFTLIELLVVLLIIGILLAIAIPTFLSVTKSANNTAAQANLQLALTGAKTFYTNEGQTYQNLLGGATVSDIQQIDTGLSYVTGTSASAGPHQISAYTGNNGTYVILTGFAVGTNDCWGILDVSSPQASAVQGHSGTGTFFFVQRNSSISCAASTYNAGGTAVSAQSDTGWPHG